MRTIKKYSIGGQYMKWLEFQPGQWSAVKQRAMDTIGKTAVSEPDEKWKRTILRCEHSPIRDFTVTWTWEVPYWVSVHLVRHKFGVEHFVRSQRSDRTGIDRDSLTQDATVTHTSTANAQALINMARKRLCGKASVETRDAVEELKRALCCDAETKPIADAMVCECVYRGFCPEFKSCGYTNTQIYKDEREAYVK